MYFKVSPPADHTPLATEETTTILWTEVWFKAFSIIWRYLGRKDFPGISMTSSPSSQGHTVIPGDSGPPGTTTVSRYMTTTTFDMDESLGNVREGRL